MLSILIIFLTAIAFKLLCLNLLSILILHLEKVEMIYLLSQRQEMVEESMPSVLNPRIFKLYYVAWKISSKDEGNEHLSERNFNFDHRK